MAIHQSLGTFERNKPDGIREREGSELFLKSTEIVRKCSQQKLTGPKPNEESRG